MSNEFVTDLRPEQSIPVRMNPPNELSLRRVSRHESPIEQHHSFRGREDSAYGAPGIRGRENRYAVRCENFTKTTSG